LLLLICAIYCATRILGGGAFESNILGLMPDQMLGPGLHPGIGGQFEKRFVIVLGHPDGNQGSALAQTLQKQLMEQPLLDVDGGDRHTLDELRAFFKPYRHQLLAPQTRGALQTQDADSLASAVVKELYNPVGTLRLYSFAEDPFNLGGAWLQSVFPDAARYRGTAIPSLRADGQIWHLIHGEVRDSPFDLASQQALTSVVERFGAQHDDVDMLFSGMVFHAAEASRIARFEISTVGSGSLLGVLLLVTVIFRSRKALGAIAFTLGSSVLLALTTTFLVFDRVHLVTLAFGSTLLGLAVDYCFHFLIKYRVHGDAQVAGRLIRKGLLIGAASSIAAYLIQLFSPFPGLQQLAVFISAGLVGACCAVAALALCYREPARPEFSAWLAFYGARVEPLYQWLSARRLVAWLLLLALFPALAGYLLWQGSNDDIRLLNTSGKTLLDSERRVQTLLGGIDPRSYWVIEGKDQQQVLARAGRLAAAINDANGTALLAVTRVVPPLSDQQRDHALVADKLYGPQGALPALCAMLASDCGEWQSLPGAFRDGLTPENIPAAIADQFPPLAMTNQYRTIALQRQDSDLSQQSVQKLAQLPGVSYVDQVHNLSATLAAFRVEVSMLLVIFLVIFVAACLFFYGRRGLLILASVLVSSTAGLALSASGGITLFHILALLLVTGLAVDTAVFYLELGLNGHTWLASTLAMATSILAFGLLSLSKVPLLHHFGSVVFIGLFCAWLITPLLFQLAGGVSERDLTGRKQ